VSSDLCTDQASDVHSATRVRVVLAYDVLPWYCPRSHRCGGGGGEGGGDGGGVVRVEEAMPAAMVVEEMEAAMEVAVMVAG